MFENQYVSEAKFNVVPYETGRYRFCLNIDSAQQGLSRYIMQRDVVWDLHIAGADLHHGHARVSRAVGDNSKGARKAVAVFFLYPDMVWDLHHRHAKVSSRTGDVGEGNRKPLQVLHSAARASCGTPPFFKGAGLHIGHASKSHF